MALAARLIKQGDGWWVIPLGELEQMDPLGESPICQEKRRPKCAMPYCKTPIFFECCTGLIKSWRRKRALAVVFFVTVFFTVPTMSASLVRA